MEPIFIERKKCIYLSNICGYCKSKDIMYRYCINQTICTEFKVKELKENSDDRDKITISESTADADGTKPMIGSGAFPDQSNFISESPSQTPIGSMEEPQKEKKCPDCGSATHYYFVKEDKIWVCDDCR